jgi:ribonuclease T2
MPSHSKFPRRLTPLQIALIGFLILAGTLYERVNYHDPQASQPTLAVNEPDLPASASTPGVPSKPPTSTRTVQAATPSGDFDYFVLALSWSPDYCSTNAANDPQQCAAGKKLGFVLHGLWPQYTQGYPSDCSNTPLPAPVKADFAGLYPNDNLFEHEWSKHGTCSGMDARAYLELTQRLKQSLAIPAAYLAPSQPFRSSPAALKQAFEQSNPDFGASSFEVSCSSSGRYLKELDVCFAKDGQPAGCGADVHKDALKSCAGADFLVRNAR